MLVLAHRGLTRSLPENTVEALAAAVDAGCDGVEFDVRTTADGQLVLWHDRLSPDGRPVSATTRAELTAAAGRPIPTLSDALDALPGAFLDVEVKDDASALPAARLLEARGRTDGVVITSFRHDRLARLAAETALPLGPIFVHRPADFGAFLEYWAARPTVRTLAIEFAATEPDLVARAAERGFAVFTWGFETPDDHRAAARAGAAALVTDHPEYAR